MNQEPHAAPEPAPSFLAREGPFILASIIGLTYFVENVRRSLVAGPNTGSSSPLLEELLKRQATDGTLSGLFLLIAQASFNLIPPVAGLAMLLYFSKKRRPVATCWSWG